MSAFVFVLSSFYYICSSLEFLLSPLLVDPDLLSGEHCGQPYSP